MPKEPPRILAVNPGSRYIGIAAFRGPELLDWGVKVVSGKTPSGKLGSVRAILPRLRRAIRSRRAGHQAAPPQPQFPPPQRTGRARSKPSARRRGIKVYQYSIQDLKDALCPAGRANKRKLAEAPGHHLSGPGPRTPAGKAAPQPLPHPDVRSGCPGGRVLPANRKQLASGGRGSQERIPCAGKEICQKPIHVSLPSTPAQG